MTKKFILKRIREQSNLIEEAMVSDRTLCGFSLLNFIYKKVDSVFSEYDANRTNCIVFRIYKNLQRGQCAKFLHI